MTRSKPFRIGIVLLLALLVGACGPPKEPIYSPAKTRACLVDKGASIGGRLDFVASTATGGAFRVKLPDNELTIAFGATVEDAQQIESAYVRFHAENVGIEDILHRVSNAVLLWKHHPEPLDQTAVEGCLS